ncbi:MAG: DM13 domain-containing protein [Actinobacteria bacterium]|nr:DM13 domain-containing protein [Actinomycetota bacterium]
MDITSEVRYSGGRGRRPLAVLAVPAAIATALAGLWVAGGVITNDFRASMGLTALWFAIVFGASLLLWRRVRALRVAAAAAALTMVVAGGYLAVASMVDRTVNEALPSAPPVATGSFRSIAHTTTGSAELVERASGRVLVLRDFRTHPGPDLQVYVSEGQASGESIGGAARVGSLKGNVGNQQYLLPPDIDSSRGLTVHIWCRAFSVPFGAANLPETGIRR